MGIGLLIPASGELIQADRYLLNISVPVTIPTDPDGDAVFYGAGKTLHVLELPYQPSHYDVVLGMDMISDYHITLFGQVVVFSV